MFSIFRDQPARGAPIINETRWLVRQIRPQVARHSLSLLCICAASILALLTPLILKWLIDSIIPHRRMGLLLVAVLVVFLAHESRVALNNAGNYIMLNTAQQIGLQLRMKLLRHLDTLSADYYESASAGAVMYPLKEPIEEIAYFGSDLFPAILRILFTTIFTMAAMFALTPVLTLAIIPLIPIFILTRQHYRTKLAEDADGVQHRRLAANEFLQEHISAVIPIQLLGREKRQERMAFRLLARTIRAQQRLNRTGIKFAICSSLPVIASMCAVIAYGGASVARGTLTVGSLVAFYGFIAQLFDPLSGAAELYARAQKTFASIRTLQTVLGLKPSILNRPRRVAAPGKWDLEFQNVEFSYPRQKHLLHIPSLRIETGEHVAIAGENGTGKSTTAKLIARLYDPVSGSVQIGGVDLRNVDLHQLRSWICYLPRDPILFEGTILSNLRFVRPAASRCELEAAIQDVGLSALIATLPQSMHRPVGPGGCQLSGGERQRLALARALLQKPRVLIIDEATSCLDSSGEVMVMKTLRSRLKTTTFIVISHRPSTLSMFPKILVVTEGRVQEDIGMESLRTVPGIAARLSCRH